MTKLDSQLYPVITTNSTKPNEVVTHLENKLETVVPDIKRGQEEVNQRLQTVETLISKAQTSDDKTSSIINKLNEMKQKLVDISSNYQVLLQIVIGYFKNLEEIDKKAENINGKLNKLVLPQDIATLESFAREFEEDRQTVLERFRFAQAECEQIINQHIKKQVKPFIFMPNANTLNFIFCRNLQMQPQ